MRLSSVNKYTLSPLLSHTNVTHAVPHMYKVIFVVLYKLLVHGNITRCSFILILFSFRQQLDNTEALPCGFAYYTLDRGFL